MVAKCKTNHIFVISIKKLEKKFFFSRDEKKVFKKITKSQRKTKIVENAKSGHTTMIRIKKKTLFFFLPKLTPVDPIKKY